jgi:hypothetical protein
MADALDELGDLSEYLQRRNIILVKVYKGTKITIRVFDLMISESVYKLTSTLQEIEFNIYKNIYIQNSKVKQINTSSLVTTRF